MKKFVVPRPVKKIHRKYVPIDSEKRKIRAWSHFFSIRILWIIFLLFALIYGGYYALSSTIFAHQYVIKRVLYDSWDVAWYDDPYLYKLINMRIKGENYYVARFFRSRIMDDINVQYPMVDTLDITYTSSNTVSVKLTFLPIDLVIRNQEDQYALIASKTFPITSWNKIANGIKILDMPSYLSGVHTLSGLFFRQPASGLVQQVELLYQWFPWLHHIEYLPGGERSIVYLDGKKFYINNGGDIANQIRNYQLLKKYYKDYNQLEDIDLGSLENDKVIVRKF